MGIVLTWQYFLVHNIWAFCSLYFILECIIYWRCAHFTLFLSYNIWTFCSLVVMLVRCQAIDYEPMLTSFQLGPLEENFMNSDARYEHTLSRKWIWNRENIVNKMSVILFKPRWVLLRGRLHRSHGHVLDTHVWWISHCGHLKEDKTGSYFKSWLTPYCFSYQQQTGTRLISGNGFNSLWPCDAIIGSSNGWNHVELLSQVYSDIYLGATWIKCSWN